MGAEPYCYVTRYKADIQEALDILRAEEFAAGRYEPCFQSRTGKYLFELQLEPRHGFPSPGACHDSIESMYAEVDETGTQSILDITEAVAPAAAGAGAPGGRMDGSSLAFPVNESDLNTLFGTAKPTSEQVLKTLLATGKEDPQDLDVIRARDAFWDQIGRADARYIILYRDGEPDEIFFAGFTAD